MIRKFLASLRGASADRKGVTAAEYAILAVGGVVIVGLAVVNFRTSLLSAFTQIGTEISDGVDAVRTGS